MADRIKKKFLYEDVKDKLIAFILEKEMSPQDVLPSESEISEMYHVSKMTVKMALKSLEEKEIVYRLPRRGSFLSEDFKNKIEQLSSGESWDVPMLSNTKNIALVVPESDYYIGRIMTAITNETERQGWNLIIRFSEGNQDRENEILSDLTKQRFLEGIILFPVDSETYSSEILRLKLDKFPLVIIDRALKELALDCISHDNYQGAFEATKYLMDKGHREIGFLSAFTQSAESREERYQGFLHALMENSVAIKQDYIVFVEGGYCRYFTEDDHHVLRSPIMKQLEDFLNENKELTAVFCSDDYLAIELYYAAERLGLKIPDDLSIMGFCDNRILNFIPIRLTTVSQPVDEMAKMSVSLLRKRMTDPNEKTRHIKLPTYIKERDSVKHLS